jgi:MATE family multidrug resistance protein
MKQTYSYYQRVREFIIILLPIFITQLALVSTGFFDTIMAGHVSGQDLAGVAVGVNLFMPVFGSVLGVIAGLMPIIAQYYGAGRKTEIAINVRQGMYWALLAGLGLAALGALLVPLVMAMLQLEDRVQYVACYYLLLMAAGLCPIFVAGVLRSFIDALGYTRLTMLITILAVPINILLNYLFMFGRGGFPALGGIGAGVGTAVTFYFVLALNILAVVCLRPFKEYKIFSGIARPAWHIWRSQLAVGIPIGSAMFCEQSIFGAVGMFMTVYGTGVIAAHQAAMNFSTMVYMIPLSISMTLTILVGFEIGAKRFSDAQAYGSMGIFLSICFGLGMAAVLISFRSQIAALYTADPAVGALLEQFLIFSACLHAVDGVSAPMQGTLRGCKDVRVTLLLAILSYWIIGLPTGYLFANYLGSGPFGYWIGLVLGIGVGALFLGIRLRRVQQRMQLMKL